MSSGTEDCGGELADDGIDQLFDVATSFAVRGELNDHLVRVHQTPFDPQAQAHLRDYLGSSRMASGTEAAGRLTGPEPRRGGRQ